MRIEAEEKLDYSDVLIRPKRSTLTSRKNVDLLREFSFYWGKRWRGIPLVAANMDTTGTLEMGRALYERLMLTCLSKHIDAWETDEDYRNPSMVPTYGMSEPEQEQLLSHSGTIVAHEFMEHHPFLCLDVANGYMQGFVDFVKNVRENWPDKIIIAGNVVTAEMTEALIHAGS